MSFLRNIYYEIKPYLPEALRVAIRKQLARRALQNCRGTWPINESAGSQPEGWPGWPDGKRFAFVLTHDVEGACGVAKSRQLADLDLSFGFRSSFNFVPEGAYDVPADLRRDLSSKGIEIGVHDLRHDGKLYRREQDFSVSARKINEYLKDWQAVGFRSGFMHHNLAWLHALDIEYDMSTFDTDPFEPQPDNMNTIFPFWVEGLAGQRRYLELPYTLPQDSTLFLFLGERSISTWKSKLDWIAQRGGMALLNTHPDYISFDGTSRESHTYPSALYEEFLSYVKNRYGAEAWSCRPRELSTFMRQKAAHLRPRISTPPKKIWIDLDNTPHVPFFKPIISELERRGNPVLVTSRRAFQVCELADEMGLKHTTIGRHYGKNSVAKVVGLFLRALQFLPLVLRDRPALAVSHGARSQILICNLLRIPTVLLADYEHASILPFLRPTWLYVPEVIPTDGLMKCAKHVRQYPGIKEDVYVPGFRPSQKLQQQLQLDPSKVIVTVRPPANEAHYRSPESDKLFETTMDHLCARSDVQIVLLPRNKSQLDGIAAARPDWLKPGQTIVPKGAIDGLDLIWHSDLVISGGGTMNREAAALKVPVYSIFRGKTGAVDKYLATTGRLRLFERPSEIISDLRVEKRRLNGAADNEEQKTLPFIVDEICSLSTTA
jgi:uncharacterized protein